MRHDCWTLSILTDVLSLLLFNHAHHAAGPVSRRSTVKMYRSH